MSFASKVAPVPQLIQGRIVFPKTPLPDPQGKNPKPGRAYAVISSSREIADGEPYWVVAITGEIFGDPDEVELKWSKDGNSRTGLKKRSVAKSCWQEWLYSDDFEIGKGLVEPVIIEQIRIKAEPCRKEPPDPVGPPLAL